MIPVYRFRVQRSGLKNTKPTHIKLGMKLFQFDLIYRYEGKLFEND